MLHLSPLMMLSSCGSPAKDSEALDLQQVVAYVKGVVSADDPGPSYQPTDRDAPVLRTLSDGLLVAYMIDKGNHFAYVKAGDLGAANITPAALDGLAVQNLGRRARGKVVVEARGPVFTARFDGNLEASLLLLDDFWDATLREHVGANPVVAVPSRDVIAFCPGDSVAGVAELRAVVSRVWPGGDHLVSRSLYSRRNGQWVVVR